MSFQRGAVAAAAVLALLAWVGMARPASTEPGRHHTDPASPSGEAMLPAVVPAPRQTAASIDEPIQYRLLRTLQIGSPQGVTAKEMLAYADGNEAD